MNTVGNLIDKIYGSKSLVEIEQLMARLENVFNKDSEQAIDDLYTYIRTVPITRWSHTAMQVLQKIGFPANQKALSIIVDTAASLNDPGYKIALEMAKDIGEFTLPQIKSGLEYYSQDYVENNLMIEGYCVLMEQLGSPVIDPLMPELLHLLESGNDENYVYEYALWPIRKIGSPNANGALPIICEKMMNIPSERIRKISLDALHDFDPLALQQFVPILRERLADESEIIRGRAQEMLERIENHSGPPMSSSVKG